MESGSYPVLGQHREFKLYYMPGTKEYGAGCRGPWPAWRAYAHWQKRKSRTANHFGVNSRSIQHIAQRGRLFSKLIKENELRTEGKFHWLAWTLPLSFWWRMTHDKYMCPRSFIPSFWACVWTLIVGLSFGFLLAISQKAQGSDFFAYAEGGLGYQTAMTEEWVIRGEEKTYVSSLDVPPTIGKLTVGVGWKMLHLEFEHVSSVETGLDGGFNAVILGVRHEWRF